MSSDTVPRWPRIDAIVREDGSGEVTIDGTFHPISAGSLEEARVEVLRRVTENAARVGRPVRASATGPEGLWNLIVHPDGTVVPEEDELAPPSSPTPQAPPASAEPMPGAAGQSGQADQAGPTAPGPAFEGMPAVGLPPRAEPGADQFEPTGPADQLAASNGDGLGQTGTADPLGGAGAVDQDPLASAVEIDPDDTVRRVPTAPQAPSGAGPEADGDPGVADWVRENADGVPGSTPGNLSGSVPGDMAGNGARSVSGQVNAAPVNAAPVNGAPVNGAPVNAAPVNGAPVNAAPVDAVPTAGSPGAGAGLSAPPSDPAQAGEPDAPRSRREARQSFLTHQQDEDPATHGFRGMLTRMGIRVGPSEAERAERADERAVSQHWPGPRTISMVNGKGGAGKTPSTVLLAAVFAQFGGAGVVTWDNNQTRGTLGWRTEQGPHESTLLDLLPQTDRLLGPSAQAADLARYVHHQTRDRFDVLRSKPIAMANEQRIEPQDVDAIHSVLSKYYRMILIDSGNDESDPMWQRMIDLTDQLVVATTTRDDHAEAGALLLEALATRDGRSAYLAQQAVVVVSQADQKESAGELEKVADGYRSLAREVVTIPFDQAMVDGHLRYGALRPETRRAWLAAGAAIAGGL
ncbi:ATPase [Promicromonospora sp. NPDC057138]|uniref:ATPase n=1 Tax=Promicromonospora sp. NPDC057138 TaxID=3346031 RepID=UPI00363F0CD1